jgi:membrane protein
MLDLFKQTFSEWSRDKASRLAAAMAYYAIFSMAPLLVVAVQLLAVGLGGQEAAHRALHSQIAHVAGPGVSKALDGIVKAQEQHRGQGVIAAIIGWIMLLLGALGMFGTLQDALNTIWRAPESTGFNLKRMLRDRSASFAMVLVVAVLLFVMVVASSLIVGLSSHVGLLAHPWIAGTINGLVTASVATLLFAAIYKFLPDTHVKWSDTWHGAVLTAILFVLGQYLLAWYLGRASTASVYGAAGSLVVVLLWLYYAAQIFFFGAEFTRVAAERRGSRPAAAPPR